MDKEVKYVCYMCKTNSSATQIRGKVYSPVFSLGCSLVCVECSNHFIMGYVRTAQEQMDQEVKYVCYLCKIISSDRQNRRKVYSPVCSLESSLVCVECSNHFIIGYVRTDQEEPLYACEECDKVYETKKGLRLHSYEHSNDWPLHCEVCGEGLATKSRLIRHEAQHSTEMPYKCDVCHFTFKIKYYLVEHMKTHNNQNAV